VWEELLKDKSFTQIRAAAIRFLHTDSQFAPTPGQLIQSAAEQASLEAHERERLQEARRRLEFAGGHVPEVSEEVRQKNLDIIRGWLKKLAREKGVS